MKSQRIQIRGGYIRAVETTDTGMRVARRALTLRKSLG
jgi:hypothetical protein